MNLKIRAAEIDDIPELEQVIALSARGLACADYTREQIEGALGSAWGVDRQLIRDRTYFVVEAGKVIVACGGWSKRQALFGADSLTQGAAELLDPKTSAARIRAFFVRPEWARRGVGSLLLEHCESAARAEGYHSTELVATLPGVRLYAARGYQSAEPIKHELPNGQTITFVPMRKAVLARANKAAASA